MRDGDDIAGAWDYGCHRSYPGWRRGLMRSQRLPKIRRSAETGDFGSHCFLGSNRVTRQPSLQIPSKMNN
jgi:hypothetical protein